MAATGTPTTNIGLRRPQGTDPASVDDINYNSGVIDTKMGAVGNTSLQAQVNALNSNLASLVVYERHELTFGQCSPNTDYTQTKDISKTGYSVLGVVDFSITGTYGTHFHASEMTIVSYTNLRVKIRANSSSSFTTDNTKVSALVLYKKIIS